MAGLLLDTLRKAELDQYYSSFSSNGITQLESLAQLSMQDYSSLGITSIGDRKKLFQSLRQELPTLENGLVSSPSSNSSTISSPSLASTPTGLKTPQSYRRRPQQDLTPKNSPIPSSAIPDLSTLSMSRRPPNSAAGASPQSTAASLNVPPPTRSRSRTLPDQSQRPEFLKSGKSPAAVPEHILTADQDDESSDEESRCEIRRSSGPLLNPYGIPIQNKLRSTGYNQQRSNSLAMPAFLTGGTSPVANANSPVTAGQSDLNQKIRVVVRKRPLNKKELEKGEKDISSTVGIRSINVNEPKTKVDLTKYIEQHSFTFDDVFDSDASNDQLYKRTAQPLVKYVFDGGRATCFAYGQTGSGKTYTMLDPKQGLYVLAARDVFTMLRQPQYEHLSAFIGFYEIYQGQLYDLLNNRKKLFAREDGKQNVVIVGLKEYVIKNVEDLMQVFEYGSLARSTGSTGANSDSSRSHAVLQILLKPTKSRKKIAGKLCFIDLAGSERGADRGDADVKTRMEGAEINKSLLALKECIRALDQDKRHTPFRQSKLTQVLKDSFVGNSRTCMIATISPNQSNSEHTLNTLRYADRVKELKGERDRRALGDNTAEDNNARLSTGIDDEDYSNDNGYPDDDGYGDNEYLESDDPELYNEAEDEDVFLQDEGFPSEADINILDEDFPHENPNNGFYQDIHSPGKQPPYLPRRHGHSYNERTSNAGLTQAKPRSSMDSPRMRSSGMEARSQESRFDRGLLSSSPDASLDINDVEIGRSFGDPFLRPPLSRDTSVHSMNRSVSSASLNDYLRNTNKPTQPPPPTASVPPSQKELMDGCPLFEPAEIDKFIKVHRAQIREVTDFCKKETKLLSNFSLSMSSRRELQEGGKTSLKDDLRTSSEFIDYLADLDEVLVMKIGAIEALRDRIRSVTGDEEF
ncbi:P-loop containing nucleoside triphosphate hydrolase protein [Radiomyces spectabilis]|uniref:P-loop containing nucleoside triphosphate hydrolase protein n=1 Tax=Radiomyces spectabilis TaxID=64574 RepID=UPI00222007E9|nr:P-loop containing nucleoside triphosphate hydrolase protein [Radiomyces spectabilis]KAI8377733.1 P-loop containing nucleoside triphosphate hydrolase protein [Radiomyces spectabilis]